MNHIKKYILLFIFFTLCPALFAGGNDYNSGFGSKILSLNGLYFAGAPGLSTLQSNPAGLLYLDTKSIELSVVDNVIQNEFDSPSRGLFKTYKDDHFIFSGGVKWNFNNNFAAAISYNPAINSKVDWPFVVQRVSDSASVTLAFSMMNKLEINSVSPSVAFKLGSLSVGLTANIYHVKQQVSFPIVNERWDQQGLGLASYQFGYNLDGWGYGGTLGLMYDFNEDIRLGLSVRSSASAEIEGDAETGIFAELEGAPNKVNASTEIEIPWRLGLGVLYLFNERTIINLDCAYTLWGNNKENLIYTIDNPVWQSNISPKDSALGFSPVSIPQLFDNSIDIGVGIEYLSSSGLAVRGGYHFAQSHNSSETFSYLYPGVSQHLFSFGIGLRDENLIIDAGIIYSLGVSEETTITDNNNLFDKYSSGGYIPSLTLRYEIK